MVTLVREQAVATSSVAPTTIRECLAAQGIRPFSTKLINRYKSWQLRRHTPLRSRLVWFAVMQLPIVFLALFVGGFCLTATALFMIDAGVASPTAHYLETLGIGAMWLSLPTSILSFVCWQILGRTHVPFPYWVEIELQSWRGVLPLHVAETAKVIREHLPNATIFVDLLMFRSIEVDPIMFIYDEHSRRLNLEVWGPNVPRV